MARNEYTTFGTYFQSLCLKWWRETLLKHRFPIYRLEERVPKEGTCVTARS
jgi:hypothetical protein